MNQFQIKYLGGEGFKQGDCNGWKFGLVSTQKITFNRSTNRTYFYLKQTQIIQTILAINQQIDVQYNISQMLRQEIPNLSVQSLNTGSSIQQQHMSTFQQCMDAAGMANTYQRNMLFVFAPYWLIASLFLFQQLYTFQQVDYICKDTSLSLDECEKFLCDPSQHIFNPKEDIIPNHSLTEEFGLYCEKEYMRIMYKECPQVLAIIGYVIYGMVGDYKGRMVAAKISWRFFVIGLLFFSLANKQFLMTFGYILASINCLPTLILQLTLLFEQSNSTFRATGCMVVLASYGFGEFVISFTAQPIIDSIDCRNLILVMCAAPTFIIGLFLGQFIESPRFLYGKSKVKALNLLNIIAQKNKLQRLIIDLSKSEWIQNYRPHRNISYLQGFLFSTLRSRLFIGMTLLFTAQLSSTSAQVILDQYLNTYVRGIVVSLTTSCTFAVFAFFVGRLRRSVKVFLWAGLATTCLLGILYLCLDEKRLEIPVIIASALLRIESSMAFGVLLIWAVETFPTVYRVMGASMAMIGASLANIIPYVWRENVGVQILWILGATIVSLPFSYKMPDTLGEDLKDDLRLNHFWDRDRYFKY